MADEAKKTEPVKPLTQNVLRKMALAGKSLPSVKPTLPSEEGDEVTMKGIFRMDFGVSDLRLSK
jgi:hypothetical protein